MFPFWEVAVAPVLEAAGARRLVEIGALRGEQTRLVIDRLGPDAELHVVDPLPDFDPAEHEREFGGQYVFHRDLSLNVLGELPPMDAALIDGDHNYYTVANELRLLRETARGADAPLPVLILHDVGWPYGRRDLYYDPTNIPAEGLRDWRRAGMEPGAVRLVPYGAGLNPTLANAKVEGGRRNGVMTAVDDFVAGHDRPLRMVVLPIYFGLAIVVEVERLDATPAMAAELDRLESPEGKDQLLALAEDIRLRALIFQHRIFYDRESSIARLARRYLGQLREGALGSGAGPARLAALEECLDTVRAEHVQGGVAAAGLATPEAVVFLAAYLDSYELRRCVWALPAEGAGWDSVRAGCQSLDLTTGRLVAAKAPPPGHRDGAQSGFGAEDGSDEAGGSGDPVVGPSSSDRREGARTGFGSGAGVGSQSGEADDSGDTLVESGPWPDQLALLHVGSGTTPMTDGLLGDLVSRVAFGGYVVMADDVEAGAASAVAAEVVARELTACPVEVDAGFRIWRKTTVVPTVSRPGPTSADADRIGIA